MNELETEYCRLEIHPWIYPKDKIDIKQKSVVWKDRTDIGIEYFEKYSLLKNRVIELSNNWKKQLLEKREINSASQENSEHTYLKFLICNRYGDVGWISTTHKGWLAPTTYFYGYIARYYAKLYGFDNYMNHLTPIKGDFLKFIDCAGEVNCVNEIELISENLLDILLEDFFDKDKISKDSINKECHREAEKKGYIK